MDLRSFLADVGTCTLPVLSEDAPRETVLQHGRGRSIVAIGTGLPASPEGSSDPFLGASYVKPSAGTSIAATLEDAPLPSGLPSGGTLREVMSRLALVAKDASPDSLLAAFILMARIGGVEASQVLRRWIASVAAWDAGVMPQQPLRSWPALASTLSHTRFPTDDAPPEMRLQRAWDRTFRFLVESMRAGWDPDDIPPTHVGEATSALAAMRRLHQLYEDLHAHATKFRLSLPLRDAPERRVTVDALCYVEDEASDAVKMFGRNDTTRSSAGRGFGVNVSLRPNAPAWNRFTIHTDPLAGLDLTELWKQLERRETEACRERNKPRKAGPAAPDWDDRGTRYKARSFEREHLKYVAAENRARTLENVANIWVNPWYISPDGSLIGSPGKDADSAVTEATALTWKEVIDTLWSVYQPLQSIKVFPVEPRSGADPRSGALGALTDFLAVPPIASTERGGPYLRLVKWPGQRELEQAGAGLLGRQPRALVLDGPSIRLIAMLAGRAGDEKKAPSWTDLPAEGAYDFVKLTGGFAVITHGGCIVVDDWEETSLDMKSIDDAFGWAVRWQDELTDHANRLEARNKAIGPLATDPRNRAIDWAKALAETTRERSLFLSNRIRAAPENVEHDDARVLYQRLRTFWGIASREALVSDGYEQLENSTKALIEVRFARFIRFLGIYGIAATLAVDLSRPMVQMTNAILLGALPASGQLELSPNAFEGWSNAAQLLGWVACTALLAWLIRVVVRWWDPFTREGATARTG